MGKEAVTMFFFFFDNGKEIKLLLKDAHTGLLRLGDFGNVDCATIVVNGRVMRLVKKASFLEIIGGGLAVGVRKCERLLMKTRMYADKASKILDGIRLPYSLSEGAFAQEYYPETLLVDFANLIISLRRARALDESWSVYAENCERLLQGLAKTGLTALIDDATGYNPQKDEYRRLFEEFISQSSSKWVKEFPDSFFEGVYKVYHLEKKGRNHPQFFAWFINKYVYWPLANSRGAILESLRERNPIIRHQGRKCRLHQFLTAEVGKPALREHLLRVGVLLQVSNDKGAFLRNFKKAFPHSSDQLEFDFVDGFYDD